MYNVYKPVDNLLGTKEVVWIIRAIQFDITQLLCSGF